MMAGTTGAAASAGNATRIAGLVGQTESGRRQSRACDDKALA